MNQQEREQILNSAKKFFREEIVESHINAALSRAGQLKEYNIHPFLLKYLANFLEGNDSPESIAKALLYPRILGASITTIFGNKAQKMVNVIFENLQGSMIPGIDIEFEDAIDNRKKYCQLKSGPNTINKDDILTIKNHFKDAKNLAKTNMLDINVRDLIVGVIYGSPNDLNNHYKKIDDEYPVFIGADFWHRVTGDEEFYDKLIDSIGEVAIEVDASERIKETLKILAEEIRVTFER